MERRNFIVVDDTPMYAENVTEAIEQFYTSRKIYDYAVREFKDDTQFIDALTYIKEEYSRIDIIFSDQNLQGGLGTQLFIGASIKPKTVHKGITAFSHIYRVMHSDDDGRLKQNQSDYTLLYDYFVNSNNPLEIKDFLEKYEANILPVKMNGNPQVELRLYNEPALRNRIRNESLLIAKKPVYVRDIFILIMDITDNKKSEYYIPYYNNGNSVVVSDEPKKISPKVNAVLKELPFITGTLNNEWQQKFKVNPLWVSAIDKNRSVIKMFQPYNIRFEIEYTKLDNDAGFDTAAIDPFFR